MSVFSTSDGVVCNAIVYSSDAGVAPGVVFASDVEENPQKISNNAIYQDLLGTKIPFRKERVASLLTINLFFSIISAPVQVRG